VGGFGVEKEQLGITQTQAQEVHQEDQTIQLRGTVEKACPDSRERGWVNNYRL